MMQIKPAVNFGDMWRFKLKGENSADQQILDAMSPREQADFFETQVAPTFAKTQSDKPYLACPYHFHNEFSGEKEYMFINDGPSGDDYTAVQNHWWNQISGSPPEVIHYNAMIDHVLKYFDDVKQLPLMVSFNEASRKLKKISYQFMTQQGQISVIQKAKEPN